MGFVPQDLRQLRPTNTMGHKTRSKWSSEKDHGTTATCHTATTQYTYPKPDVLGTSPTFDFPIKRIKRIAGILLTLFVIWALLYAFKIF